MRLVFVFLTCLVFAFPVCAQDADHNQENANEQKEEPKGPKLPIPRFVSLRAPSVNLRTGPGDRYPIDWVIARKGLPVEITAEHDIWRQIRLSDGTQGWVNQIMLSGHRAALVKDMPSAKTASRILLRSAPASDARATAELRDDAIGAVDKCQDHWCRVKFNRYSGWVEQKYLWGVYPDEIIK